MHKPERSGKRLAGGQLIEENVFSELWCGFFGSLGFFPPGEVFPPLITERIPKQLLLFTALFHKCVAAFFFSEITYRRKTDPCFP